MGHKILNRFNNRNMHFKIGLILVLLFPAILSYSQERKKIDIIEADVLEYNENIIADAQRLIGNVLIKHNDVLMWCDSAYAYSGSNKVDAFGHVHINQGDSIQLFADFINYDGDNAYARSIGNVKLIKLTTTLYTDTLDYDMDRNIGFYEHNGKVIDSTNTLTSLIGRYFVDLDQINFYQNVNTFNDDYHLKNDTLIYNTITGQIEIQGPTFIEDKKDSTNLYAEKGWYNSKTSRSELTKNPKVSNNKQTITGNYIEYDGENSKGIALGNVEITDIENSMVVRGEKTNYSKSLEIAIVTDSAQLIIFSEEDSLFLHADTLKSYPDTIENENIISAYWGVRFYRNNIQGKCDSLIYYTKDSIVQMYTSPVLWSENRQMSSEKIEMKSKANAPDEVVLTTNAFIISQLDTGMFDQIKGKEMTAYIENNSLNKIDVNGSGQTLYYAQDENGIIGLNKAESSKIYITFQDGAIHRISLVSKPEGLLKPMGQLTDPDRTLQGFDWKQALRPISKFDIFRK